MNHNAPFPDDGHDDDCCCAGCRYRAFEAGLLDCDEDDEPAVMEVEHNRYLCESHAAEHHAVVAWLASLLGVAMVVEAGRLRTAVRT